MIYVALILSGISLGIAFWIGQQIITHAMNRYKTVFMQDARAGLREIFVFIDITHLWPALLSLATGLALISWLMIDSVVISALLALMALILPRLALARAVRNRLSNFERQLPDALLAMSCALSAGLSIGFALRQVIQDAEAPLSQEFGLILREQRVGISLAEALRNLNVRMPCESVQMATTLMRVAAISGGSLAVLLEQLSVTIRERLHIDMKISVLTSQGKMQAWIVGALPFVLLGVLSALDPYSIDLMLNTTIGQAVLGLVLCLECAGIYLLSRILEIRV